MPLPTQPWLRPGGTWVMSRRPRSRPREHLTFQRTCRARSGFGWKVGIAKPPREWDKAVEIYRTLFGFFPDNLDYGLRLASVQTSAGKGQNALATLEALRKLPPPAPE